VGYLRGWGFSPAAAATGLGAEPGRVTRWLAEEFPAIRARGKREGGVVLWCCG
jgi:hypothetical protein